MVSHLVAVDGRADDQRLVDRCLRHERAAERELFHTYRLRAHATLFRILGSNREIEDLLQETFVELFRSLASYRGEASLATWLDRIATRVAYRYFARRKNDHARLELLDEPSSGDPSAEDRLLLLEATRRLYLALDRLEPRQRVAYALHVIDERPLRDVADVMQASLVATKTRVFRAQRAIAEHARRDPLLRTLLRGDAPRGGGT